LRIVEVFAVVEHIGPRLVWFDRAFALSVRSLAMKRSTPRRIVPDVARAAHRADDAVVGHQALEVLADALTAAIPLTQQCIGPGFLALIDRPTMRRETRSMTAAT
jgi:hypothetical protein